MTDGDTAKLDLREQEEVQELGNIDELPAKDRARLALAYWILGGALFLIISAAIGLMLASPCRLEEAKTLWEFAKTFCPPVITLVIGFYFRQE